MHVPPAWGVQATIALARAGATIEDLNVVRKHLSRVKGGQLGAAAYPATTVVSLYTIYPMRYGMVINRICMSGPDSQ